MYKEWEWADQEEMNAICHDGEYDADLKQKWQMYREITNHVWEV